MCSIPGLPYGLDTSLGSVELGSYIGANVYLSGFVLLIQSKIPHELQIC